MKDLSIYLSISIYIYPKSHGIRHALLGGYFPLLSIEYLVVCAARVYGVFSLLCPIIIWFKKENKRCCVAEARACAWTVCDVSEDRELHDTPKNR